MKVREAFFWLCKDFLKIWRKGRRKGWRFSYDLSRFGKVFGSFPPNVLSLGNLSPNLDEVKPLISFSHIYIYKGKKDKSLDKPLPDLKKVCISGKKIKIQMSRFLIETNIYMFR